MREVTFIKQNKENGSKLTGYEGKVKNPDDLSSLYINLITTIVCTNFYPKRKLRFIKLLSLACFPKDIQNQKNRPKSSAFVF